MNSNGNNTTVLLVVIIIIGLMVIAGAIALPSFLPQTLPPPPQ